MVYILNFFARGICSLLSTGMGRMNRYRSESMLKIKLIQSSVPTFLASFFGKDGDQGLAW